MRAGLVCIISAMEINAGRTSSLLDCFARLALMEDAPASLLVVVRLVSRTGRGIADDDVVVDGLLVKGGMAPRPCPRPGVPLTVPGFADIVIVCSPCRRCRLEKAASLLVLRLAGSAQEV